VILGALVVLDHSASVNFVRWNWQQCLMNDWPLITIVRLFNHSCLTITR
jgi:hypothetical protein